LLEEVKRSNYCAVGKKYGVSDNAIRKWIKFYGAEPPKKLNKFI
jgi:transposase-like protein